MKTCILYCASHGIQRRLTGRSVVVFDAYLLLLLLLMLLCLLLYYTCQVYVPERGVTPINIFHGGYEADNAPIRLLYSGQSHYDAIVDPSAVRCHHNTDSEACKQYNASSTVMYSKSLAAL
jgi:hypothetical protein